MNNRYYNRLEQELEEAVCRAAEAEGGGKAASAETILALLKEASSVAIRAQQLAQERGSEFAEKNMRKTLAAFRLAAKEAELGRELTDEEVREFSGGEFEPERGVPPVCYQGVH